MKSLRLVVVLLAAFPSFAFAVDNEVELHRLKAQKYVEAKDWASAEPEAKAVVDANSQDLDGWLIYGIIEQRLEHNDEAAKAYRRYLDLNPPAGKAAAVRQRLAEVEIRAQEDSKKSSSQNEERYGSRSDGAYFTFAPYYHPATSRVLNGSVSNNFQLGLQLSHVLIGFMYASGTVPSFQAAPEGVTTGNPTFSTLGPADLKIYELYFEYNIPLTEPYGPTGPFAIYVPVHLGGFDNSLKPTSGSRSFGNLGFDVAAGLGVQWFNRTPFTVSATALYHPGYSFWSIEEDANSLPVKTPAGADVTGGNSGFEFKLTLTYLFGYDKSLEEKAGVR